jgi:hypothetical protein
MSSFEWPKDDAEAAKIARDLFVGECADKARYWIKWGMDRVVNAAPEKPFERPSSEIAREDAAFRAAFADLPPGQKEKIIELLHRCVSGAVFSTLCTLDQFPHGEASVSVREGFDEKSGRSFLVSPTDDDLHDDFYRFYREVAREEIQRNA